MNSKVIDLSQKKEEILGEENFIALLDKDISEGNASKIPSSVFDRIANIKHKALLARERNELLEM